MESSVGLFVVADSEKCTGCKACEIACFASHNKNNGVAHTVGTVSVPVTPRLYLTKFENKCMPIQCKQCEDAPCLNACSEKAITKIDGAMVISENRCIGCKNCLLACPFGAVELFPLYDGGEPVPQISSRDQKVTAFKCDRCLLTESGSPACVDACPNQALRLVNLTDETKEKKLKAAIALAAATL